MDTQRIAALLEPFLGPAGGRQLTAKDLDRISTYIDILLHWNARINLTAIRDPEEIATRHFGESLFAARHLFPSRTWDGQGSSRAAAAADPTSSQAPGRKPAHRPRVADLGSGAGFPGIPLKLWAPGISLTLIESTQKKATFLREVVRSLILTDINIQAARAESLKTTFDLVTLRAVERFDAILPTAARLVARGGCLALLLGAAQLGQARAILPGMAWTPPKPIPLSTSRILVTANRALD